VKGTKGGAASSSPGLVVVVKAHARRSTTNPQTGEQIQDKAKTVVRLRPPSAEDAILK